MKTKLYFLSIICLLANITLFAQAPEGIPYQAVARDASGNLISNQPISLRFNIHTGTAGGSIVYSESHAVSTNEFGLFSVNVGEGSTITGTLSAVDWGNGAKFLEAEFDASGGTSYTSMGTTQMMSVPYALFAAGSGDLPDGATAGETLYWDGSQWVASNNLYNNGGNVGIGITNPSQKLDVKGHAIVTGPEWAAFGDLAHLYLGDTANRITNKYGTGLQIVSYPGSNPSITVRSGSGLVGINTDNPSERLDVNGNINLAGDLLMNGTKLIGDDTFGRTEFFHVDNGVEHMEFNGYNTTFSNRNVYMTENLGLGLDPSTDAITARLDINGQIRLRGGAPAAGKVLTSSADGTATWETPTTGVETDPQVSASATDRVPKWNGSTLINGTIVDNGNIGIGVPSGLSKLHIYSPIGASLSDNGSMMLGAVTSTNMVFDGNKIQVRNNGGAANLAIQPYGGQTNIGAGGGNVLLSTNTSGGSGKVIVGTASSANTKMEIRTSNNNHAVYINNSSAFGPKYGLRSYANNFGIIGIGTESYGGQIGTRGYATNNTGAGNRIGIWGQASGGGQNYGVYGAANGSGNTYGVYGSSTYYAGYFNGSVYTSGSYLPSDDKLKSNIKSLENATSIISQLEIYSYNYKTKEYDFMNLEEGTRYGFLASNMNKVLPQFTKTTRQEKIVDPEDGPNENNEYVEFDAVNYVEMIPILTKAIQEQQAQIEILKAEIKSLKSSIKE